MTRMIMFTLAQDSAHQARNSTIAAWKIAGAERATGLIGNPAAI